MFLLYEFIRINKNKDVHCIDIIEVNKMDRNKIVVKDSYISIIRVEGGDYISFTDIAKFKNIRNPGDVIIKWMSNKS